MAEAPRDQNSVPALLATSNGDGTTPVAVYADPTTHRILVDSNASSSSGTTVLVQNGTVTIAAGTVSINSIPAGSNLIGGVNITQIGGSGISTFVNASGSATPAYGINNGLNNNGTLRFHSGFNPTGTIYVAGTDLTSIGSGTTIAVNNGAVSNGTQRVTIASDSTGVVGLNAGSNQIGTVTVRGTVSINTLPNVTIGAAIPAGTNNIGDVDVLTLPALAAGSNEVGTVSVKGTVGIGPGTNVIGSLAANQSVNVAQMNGVTVTMGNGASGTGVQRVTIASDSTGQITLASGNNHVGTVTLNGPPLPNAAISGTASITTKTSTQVIAAQGAGVKVYLTSVSISNTGTTSVEVELINGATRYYIPAPCGTAGIGMGGSNHPFPYPGLPGNANTAWNALPSATTTIKVSFNGYTSTL